MVVMEKIKDIYLLYLKSVRENIIFKDYTILKITQQFLPLPKYTF